MSIFGSDIRQELTDMLAIHLATEFRERLFRGDDGGWNQVAIDAMDFIYGEEPDSETPEESAGDTGSGAEGCCGGPTGSGNRCPGPGDGPGVRDALTGVVHPPTMAPDLQVGQFWYSGVHQSRTGGPCPDLALGDALKVPSPQGPGSAGG